MARGLILRIGLIVIVTVTMLFARSCGKKNDPVCPRSIKPGVVFDVKARIGGHGIDVSWTASEGEREDVKYRILKSELKTDECLTCPREYVLIDQLPYKSPRLKRAGGNGLTYRDSDVRNGYSYSYVVVTCTESQICSDESNRADIVFP